jgi:hypothetical protein
LKSGDSREGGKGEREEVLLRGKEGGRLKGGDIGKEGKGKEKGVIKGKGRG